MAQLKEAIVERRAAQFSFLRDLVRADTAIDNEQPIKSIERIAAMLELLLTEANTTHTCIPQEGPKVGNFEIEL